jgi:hypothetical protein
MIANRGIHWAIAHWGIGAILIGAMRHCRIGSIECHSAAIHQIT